MMGLLLGMTLEDMLLWLLRGIYITCADLYAFMLQIASFEVISQLSVREMYLRIYTIVGIVMLFKVLYSLIMYVVDPDKVSDGKDGAGKLIIRISVVFAMLAFMPFVFNALINLQNAIINDNMLGRIFGADKSGQFGIYKIALPEFETEGFWLIYQKTTMTTSEVVMTPAMTVANSVYSAFVTCEVSLDECKEKNSGKQDGDLFCENFMQMCDLAAQYPLVISPNTMEEFNEGVFFDVQFLPALIFGLVLMSFIGVNCIDMALRSVKFGVLQLLAPIPIISYVDAKTEETFKRWMKVTLTTYADLFMRISIIYLMILVMEVITIL